MDEPRRVRILYGVQYWTPVRREVFEDVLQTLKRARSGVLYLALYDKAWHSRNHLCRACLADLARMVNADERTTGKSLEELLEHRLVEQRAPGVKRSRIEKPMWSVPLANFDLKTGGPWTPVPRFLTQCYFRAYPPSLLLAFLLWTQHRSWLDHCWPGAPKLAQWTGWSRRKVYQALCIMGNKRRWERLKNDLPFPIQIFYKNTNGKWRRHFSVRFYEYTKKKGRGRSVVCLTKEFARHFAIGKLAAKVDFDYED